VAVVIRFSSWAQCAAAMLALLLMLPAPVRAEVSASVDRNRVAMSETLELRIRVDTTLAAPEPELDVLSRDFEVLGTSRNTRISLVNGQGEAYTEWIVSLAPKREGPLEIPAIPVGAEKTEPIRISVARDASPDASPNQDVMLEVAFDQSAVHVQSQLLLTVRVLHAVNLSRGASLSEPDIANAVVRQLGEDSYARTIGGRRYGVFERRYAVFPQASGELVLPPLSFQATLGANSGNWFNQFGSRGNTIRLRSPERRVTVAPPESGGGPWLPARMLTLVETWDKSPQRLRVGESATRTLTITAEGLTGAQLPPLTQPEVRGLRFYPDQPRISDEESSEGITGTRVESAAVIPSEPGELEFPEVRVRWWDTVNQRFEEAVVPRKTIRVLPAAGSALVAGGDACTGSRFRNGAAGYGHCSGPARGAVGATGPTVAMGRRNRAARDGCTVLVPAMVAPRARPSHAEPPGQCSPIDKGTRTLPLAAKRVPALGSSGGGAAAAGLGAGGFPRGAAAIVG